MEDNLDMTNCKFLVEHSDGRIYVYDPMSRRDRDYWMECPRQEFKRIYMMGVGTNEIGEKFLGHGVTYPVANGFIRCMDIVDHR